MKHILLKKIHLCKYIYLLFIIFYVTPNTHYTLICMATIVYVYLEIKVYDGVVE